jgi:hypothetical protein
MSSIKIHLEFAEAQPVERLAALLQVSTEDIAYTALDRLMMLARNPDVQKEIVEARNWRRDNLPLWADSAGSVHAYEGMSDCEPTKSKYSV